MGWNREACAVLGCYTSPLLHQADSPEAPQPKGQPVPVMAALKAYGEDMAPPQGGRVWTLPYRGLFMEPLENKSEALVPSVKCLWEITQGFWMIVHNTFCRWRGSKRCVTFWTTHFSHLVSTGFLDFLSFSSEVYYIAQITSYGCV